MLINKIQIGNNVESKLSQSVNIPTIANLRKKIQLPNAQFLLLVFHLGSIVLV